MTTEDEFWANVAIPDGDDASVLDQCWPWTRARNKDGYGVLRYQGAVRYAFHLAHDLFFGPCAPGLVRRHMCGNRACCNPFHLVVGTYSENLRDAYGMGRRRCLSDEQLASIRARRAAGETSTQIGRDLGLHPGHVRHLWRTGATA